MFKRIVSIILGMTLVVSSFIIVGGKNTAQAATYSGYVMGYFTESPNGTGHNYGLHLAYSTDALNWTPLNNNDPVITPTLGSGGLRDPFIFRKNDGTFVVLATDMNGTDMTKTSPKIHVWDSSDLITFTNERLVQLNTTSMHAWAPEVFYDASKGQYGIIWSGNTDYNRIYVNYTTDFTNVTDPQVFFDPGFSVLDATLYPSFNGVNYLYYKRESDNTILGTTSTTLEVGSFNTHTYTSAIYHNIIEAPILVKNLTDATFYLYGDSYYPVNGLFYAWGNTDITQNNWTELNKRVYNPPLNGKHGTVREITQTELNNLIAHWGTPTWNRLKSYNYPDRYVRHSGFEGRIDAYPFDPYTDSQFKLVPGLADATGVSFESVNYPGYYLRHSSFNMVVNQNDGTTAFKGDATFYKVNGLADSTWASFKSYNYPTRYIRHSNFVLYLQPISTATDKQDATFSVGY